MRFYSYVTARKAIAVSGLNCSRWPTGHLQLASQHSATQGGKQSFYVVQAEWHIMLEEEKGSLTMPEGVCMYSFHSHLMPFKVLKLARQLLPIA